MKRILLAAISLVAALYLGSYVILRQAWTERRNRDGHDYVIFPTAAPAAYYAYRPLTYLDAKLTGMRFHIGPHEE